MEETAESAKTMSSWSARWGAATPRWGAATSALGMAGLTRSKYFCLRKVTRAEKGELPSVVGTIWTELDRGLANIVKSCGTTCLASAFPIPVWVLPRLFGLFLLTIGFERLSGLTELSGSIRWLKGRNARTDGLNGFGVTFVSSTASSSSMFCPCSLC